MNGKKRSYYIPKVARPQPASKAMRQAISVFSDRLHEYARTEQGQLAALASWDYYWKHGHFASDPCNCKKEPRQAA